MKFRLVEDFDDLLLESTPPAIEPGSELEKKLIYELENTNKSYAQISKEYGVANTTLRSFAKKRNLGNKREFVPAIQPGSDLEKSLIYDIENTDISYSELARKYGLNNIKSISTLIKTRNLNPIFRSGSKLSIEPGSDLEKSLIYDIENTDIPYSELVKKYELSTTKPIYTLINRLNLQPISRKPLAPGSELEKNLIDELENTDKTYAQLSKEYGISAEFIMNFAHQKKLRDKREWVKKHHVYFNTLEGADIHRISLSGIVADLKFFPSIYIGQYSVNNVARIYDYIMHKYFNGSVNTATLIEFYLKIASGVISLKDLIDEMKKDNVGTAYSRDKTFDWKFLTISTDKLPTVDFYSDNYSQLAKDILTILSRKDNSSNDFDTVYKDLKAAATKLDPETADIDNQIKAYISNNLDNIVHNIYSKTGDIIEPTNYINGIPYETSFDVNSLQDIAKYIKLYRGYLLYGFMDKTGDIVYIGISVHAKSRGGRYAEENRPLILKAFEDGIIKKLIIFKSNLPIQSRTLNTKLLYALEIYFAEHLFKTYPENYPKALNKQKPGQNSSKIIASQNKDNFERFINKQEKLLSPEEYRSAVKQKIGNSGLQNYHYYDYAKNYIAEHSTDLSFEDKEKLYRGLPGENRELLWNICSSESEYRELIPKTHKPAGIQLHVDKWKNYRIKNNLPITEDLDDDIDMEYYI